MTERSAIIRNEAGIHCRPSAVILKEVKQYAGEVVVCSEFGETRLDSVMSLLSLGLDEGREIRIRVSGPDEEKVADRMVELFEYNFDFPPRE